MTYFKHNGLCVRLYVETVNGCCGLATVHSMVIEANPFDDMTTPEAKRAMKGLFKKIVKYVRDAEYGMFIISAIPPEGYADPGSAFYNGDAPHREDGFNMYMLAKAGRMLRTKTANNPNTSNNITVFIKTVEPAKSPDEIQDLRDNPYGDEEDDDDWI